MDATAKPVADYVRDPRSGASPVMVLAAPAAVEPVTSQPTRRPPSKPAKARRATAIVEANPDESGAELGRRLGVSERQGRRLLAQVAGG